MNNTSLRKTITSLAIILLLFVSVQSQDNKSNNIVKINPFGAFASAIPLSIERLFFEQSFSVVAGGAVISNKSGSGTTTYNNSGYAVTPEIRHYFYKDSQLPAKIYIGGFFNYEEHENLTLDRFEEEIIGTAIGRGGGLIFGNQWFFQNGFIVDFYVGPAYMSYQRTEEYDINLGKGGLLTSLTGPKNTGTKVKFGFSLGISF